MIHTQPKPATHSTEQSGRSRERPGARSPSPDTVHRCDCEHTLQVSDTAYLVLTEIREGLVSTTIFVNGWIVASKHSPVKIPGDEDMLAAQVADQQMSMLKQVAPESLAWWREKLAANGS